MGQFNLVDLNGTWPRNEGRPAERAVVIDPPAYPRRWNPGRVDRHEAHDWLARAKPSEH